LVREESLRQIMALPNPASGLRKIRFPLLYVALMVAFMMNYLKCDLDEEVGNIEPVDANKLMARFHGKTALVVGGTRGIGRGIAVALAKAGASVEVVGRSAETATKVASFLRKVAPRPAKQVFGAHAADLSTVAGCMNFTKELKEDSFIFDYVIFTVGSWPDRVDPLTIDGVDKVIALDLIARFVVLKEVVPMLAEDARVLSVLASTNRMPFPAEDTIKDLVTGNRPSYWTLQMMFAVGLSGDAFLEQAGIHYPAVKFIGTFPGLVPTNLLLTSNTFPVLFSTWAKATVQWLSKTPLPIFASEEECGETHLHIMSSPNADIRPTTYFNYLLEGRKANELSYDPDFGKWLWSFLETKANEKYSDTPS